VLSNSDISNCEPDVNNVLLDVFFSSEPPPCSEATELNSYNCSFDEDIDLCDSQTSSSLPKENALLYIAGYICKKYFTKHKNCTECIKLLQRNDVKFDNQSHLVFLHNKTYTHDKKDFGGLCVHSADLVTGNTNSHPVLNSILLSSHKMFSYAHTIYIYIYIYILPFA